MILATYTKQPDEVLDYDIDYTDWLDGDTLLGAEAAVSPSGELTVLDPMPIVGDRVKIWASSGVSGGSYKVEVTITTNGGRVKQDEVRIRVKEY